MRAVRQLEEVLHQMEVRVEELARYAVIGDVEESHPMTKLQETS